MVIKVISKGDENIHELQILQLLNSEQLKSDPLNATVPVIEFVNFLDWTFAVMPFCDESFEPVMRNADESLELAEQILRVMPPPFLSSIVSERFTFPGPNFSPRQ